MSPGPDGTVHKGKVLILHLPLVLSSLITVMFSADVRFLNPLRTEHVFGLWLLILVPLSVLLAALQVSIWFYLLVLRSRTK